MLLLDPWIDPEEPLDRRVSQAAHPQNELSGLPAITAQVDANR
jgi:hypothetical protein